MLEKVGRLAQPGDLWVLSGSLPPGAPLDTYRRMIHIIQAAGGKALVDADGENLRQACAWVCAIPGETQCTGSQSDFGMEVGSIELAVVAARRFHGSGVRLAMITLGAKGAVLSDGENTWLAKPPVIPVRSAIGAGDASLAGFVWGMSRGVARSAAPGGCQWNGSRKPARNGGCRPGVAGAGCEPGDRHKSIYNVSHRSLCRMYAILLLELIHFAYSSSLYHSNL